MSGAGARVLILGAGDAGFKIAEGLAAGGAIGHLILADRDCRRLAAPAAFLTDCSGVGVTLAEVDGLDQGQLEDLLKGARADLIVQSAALIGPWATIGKQDPIAKALARAGLGLQLPAQLPILMTLMTALRSLGLATPVANLSLPDISHALLATRGLAPTIGLGNASICLLRVRAALRAEMDAAGRKDTPLPLLRVVAHHSHVYGVMQGTPPEDAADRPQVFLGEDARRRDDLAYAGQAVPPGPVYNVITAASALPVLRALLPGAAPSRFSAPAPHGRLGGYPLRISREAVSLDLPGNTDLERVEALQRRMTAADGIAAIVDDGTVHFTANAAAAVAAVEPRLAEPLALEDLKPRFQLLRDVVSRIA